ncbi:unnamed protein product [Rotaria sp. Silwood1]|nr:unnamed protein product [Rotaria sp. Silwood1]CAF1412497.1 unnamed protein product [Rotaria sp. Silwood1]
MFYLLFLVDGYPVLLTPLLKNVNDSAKQNLATEFVEDEDLTKIIDQFVSEAANCNNSGSNGASDNIEQSTENSVDSSVDPLVRNEQCSAMASNNPVTMITLDVHWPIFLMNPILNVFRIRSKNELIREQARGIPKLKDCVGNSQLNFTPVSAFENAQVECTILSKSPDEKWYFPPYAFVLSTDTALHVLCTGRVSFYSIIFNITRRTIEDWETDFVLHQALSVSSSNSSTLRAATIDHASMNSFRIQLQLCDCSNDGFVPYRRSIVVSAPEIDDFTSSKEDSAPSSPKNDSLTDDSVGQSSTHEKRSLEKEPHERTGSPLLKSQKS